MTLPGNAFLALWNDCSPERDDYNVWHSREHVPERLSVPGFIAARRYVDGDGVLPRFLTMYSLSDTNVLASRRYGELLANPTPWSRSMRPHLARFLRCGCNLVVSAGSGMGGYAAAALLQTLRPRDKPSAVADRIVQLRQLNAAHIGMVDHHLPAVPFQTSAIQGLAPYDTVLIVEGFDDLLLRRSLPEVESALEQSMLFDRPPAWTIYRLAFALDRRSQDTGEAHSF